MTLALISIGFAVALATCWLTVRVFRRIRSPGFAHPDQQEGTWAGDRLDVSEQEAARRAEQILANASRRADQILGIARQTAAEITREAKRAADVIVGNAREEAREIEYQRNRVNQEMIHERTLLAEKRKELTALLIELLAEVQRETSGSEPPKLRVLGGEETSAGGEDGVGHLR